MTDLDPAATMADPQLVAIRARHAHCDGSHASRFFSPERDFLLSVVDRLAEALAAATEREQRVRALVGDLSRALAESLHGPWDKAQERYADGTRSEDALPDWWNVMLDDAEDVNG